MSPATIASTTTTVPTTSPIRETPGSLRFRTLKIVDIGQWPPMSTGTGTPGGGASGTCGPGPAGGGGPGRSAGGSGTGTPCSSGGVCPGTPALVMPGVYPGPYGLGAGLFMRRIIALDLDQSRDRSLYFDPIIDYSLDCDPRIRAASASAEARTSVRSSSHSASRCSVLTAR